MIASLTPILQAFCWILPLGFHFVVIGVVNNVGEDFSLRPVCSFLVFRGFFFGSAFPSVTIHAIKSLLQFSSSIVCRGWSGTLPFASLFYGLDTWEFRHLVFSVCSVLPMSRSAPWVICCIFFPSSIVLSAKRPGPGHLLPDIFFVVWTFWGIPSLFLLLRFPKLGSLSSNCPGAGGGGGGGLYENAPKKNEIGPNFTLVKSEVSPGFLVLERSWNPEIVRANDIVSATIELRETLEKSIVCCHHVVVDQW